MINGSNMFVLCFFLNPWQFPTQPIINMMSPLDIIMMLKLVSTMTQAAMYVLR